MPPRNSTGHLNTGDSATAPYADILPPTNRKRSRRKVEQCEMADAARYSKRSRTSATSAVIDLTATTPSPPATPTRSGRGGGARTATASPKEEKRLRKFRNSAPQIYLVKLERARTQRLFVLNRKRTGTEEVPEEIVDIVGSTGNLYHVHICKEPSCSCPDARKGNQCKHIVYVLHNVLKVPSHLEYQLAFLSSELRDIFQNAPPSPTDGVSTTDVNGKRKEISGDCPICFMEFDAASEEIVWCKAACWNNIHQTCFQQWAASQAGKQVRCVYCRTPWQNDVPSSQDLLRSGFINEEGYLNLGGTLGLPEERDTSTYHGYSYSGRRRYRLYGYDDFDEDGYPAY